MTEEEQKNTFARWIDRYRLLIFKVVRVYGSSPMDRDDLFQEIAIQVWRSVPAFRGESSETTWIYRISLNVALNWVRKERKHFDGKEPIDHRKLVLNETRAETDERLEWLYDEITRLEAIDRSVTLLLLDGLSYKEIASITGLSESHVGVKINRIKKYLTTKSKKYDHYGV